jgi:hypothetical protein
LRHFRWVRRARDVGKISLQINNRHGRIGRARLSLGTVLVTSRGQLLGRRLRQLHFSFDGRLREGAFLEEKCRYKTDRIRGNSHRNLP